MDDRLARLRRWHRWAVPRVDASARLRPGREPAGVTLYEVAERFWSAVAPDATGSAGFRLTTVGGRRVLVLPSGHQLVDRVAVEGHLRLGAGPMRARRVGERRRRDRQTWSQRVDGAPGGQPRGGEEAWLNAMDTLLPPGPGIGHRATTPAAAVPALLCWGLRYLGLRDTDAILTTLRWEQEDGALSLPPDYYWLLGKSRRELVARVRGNVRRVWRQLGLPVPRPSAPIPHPE